MNEDIEVRQAEKNTDKHENADIVISDSDKLAEEIKNTDSIQDFLPLFNASIAKKQAMRVLKREEIIDKVTDAIEERLKKHPDEITTAELLACDKTMSEQKQKELGIVNTASEQPAITLNQQNNNINVTLTGGLGRESNEKVIDAVKELLKIANENNDTIEDNDKILKTDVDNTNN